MGALLFAHCLSAFLSFMLCVTCRLTLLCAISTLNFFPLIVLSPLCSTSLLQISNIFCVIFYEHLLRISFNYPSFSFFCRTDQGVIAIARHMPHLTGLNIADCMRVDNSGLLAVARGLRKLQHLNISGLRIDGDPGKRERGK